MPIDLNSPDWKEIPGHRGYFAHPSGHIASTWWGQWSDCQRHLLKATADKFGYCRVSTSGGGGPRVTNVARLVLATFTGPCPPGKEANHKSGVKSDNGIDNLEWLTHGENMKHADRLHLRTRHTVLTKADVHSIRNHPERTLRLLAEEFHVCLMTVWKVRHRITWKHV